MTRRRWIADEVAGSRAALTGSHARHLSRVLRAQVGQEFDIVTDRDVRRGRVVSVDDARIEFELGESATTPALPDITLLLAIFKFDRMEWAIEKVTELGVSRIVPVLARRTETHLASAASKRHERWQRLVHQASEQSRRSGFPEVSGPTKLADAVQIQARARILLAESENERMLGEALEPFDSTTSLALAIGPEGGWSSEEVTLFISSGFLAASLGPTILRAETAAIAAVAIAVSQLA